MQSRPEKPLSGSYSFALPRLGPITLRGACSAVLGEIRALFARPTLLRVRARRSRSVIHRLYGSGLQLITGYDLRGVAKLVLMQVSAQGILA
ncbi:hypothetical protein BAY60_35755 (plasmid) [Prauserella muralis]|uniref:Uncharacterized protein n=1 Tax=Prauserella muralis TaxID=588067 RepID=A0A2V4AEX5_9PSEU|nr:hypothetical protein BAY60_35755 [Prauserella muralis]